MATRAPVDEQPLGEDATATPWIRAAERLSNPEPGRACWLSTVHSDARPHVTPILGLWFGLPGIAGTERGVGKSGSFSASRWRLEGAA